jgi:hypothetical protein
MGKVQYKRKRKVQQKNLGERATCTEGKIREKITIKQGQRLRNK